MFTKFKQAVAAFIETCKELTEASRDLTQGLRENTAALREYSAALLTKTSTIDSIAEHAEYLATSEEHRLKREGRTHIFKG